MGNLLIGSILVIICIGIGCLRSCKEKMRTCLFWDTVVFFAALALHFGGNIVLGFFELAWRNPPGAVLPTVLVVSFLAWIIFALCCYWSREDIELYKTIVGIIAGVAFLSALWMGLFIVGAGYSGEERIVESQGWTLVEVCDDFPNESYTYYEYHGPLLRGSKGFYGLGRHGSLTGSEEWLNE